MNDNLSNKPKIQNNLKYYREKLGVTQQEIEWRTGVGRNQWSKYESGEREPKITLVYKFVSVYNAIALEKGITLSISTTDIYPPQ